ncbi:Vitamin B12-binding protein [uncultured archaeon]|nr:Vitamin B12-binding protein [uncultured archaeon]
MRLLFYYLLSCIVLQVLFAGSLAQSDQKIGVVDFNGREVEVSGNITSIVSLDPDATRILIALGAGDLIKGVEATSKSCPVTNRVFPQVQALPDVGSASQGTLSLEKLAKIKPDVVFLRGLHQDTAEKIQSELKIPCVCTYGSVKDVEDYLKTIRIIGKTVSRENRSAEISDLIEDKMAEINNIVSSVPDSQKKRVLYIAPPFTKDLLRVIYNQHLSVYNAGGINVAYSGDKISSGSGPWKSVSLEQVAGWDPDMIFIHGLSFIGVQDVLNNSDWKDLRAVKDQKVYKVFAVSTGYDPSMIVLSTMQMAKIMYPDRLNFDFQKEADQVCQQIYGVGGLPEFMESEYGITRT